MPRRNDESLSADQRTLEAQLAALALPPLVIDRDAVMYQAGWQAAQAVAARPWTHRAWPLATACSLAASLVMAVLLARQPSGTVQPVAFQTQPAPDTTQELVQDIAAASPRPDARVLSNTWYSPWYWPAPSTLPATSPILSWRSQLSGASLDDRLATDRTASATSTPPLRMQTSRELLDQMLKQGS